jgi:BlaI family penicillinase repressor
MLDIHRRYRYSGGNKIITEVDMDKQIQLTDSEWKIIEVLWADSPRTLRQIIDAVSPSTGWSKHTVISFLKRMQQKGSIRAEEASPARLYYALVDRDSVVSEERDHMLDKLYGGSSKLLVSHMVDKLGREDIEELIAILQDAKKDGNDEMGH